jgi:hypothetical protein
MSRILRIAGIVWIAVVAARYLGVVLKTLRNPFNPGFDLAWLALSLGFVALVGVSLVWRREQATRIGVAALVSSAAVIILQSGALVPALIALWVLSAATVLGDIFLVRLGLASRDNLCDRFRHSLSDRHRGFRYGRFCARVARVFFLDRGVGPSLRGNGG